MSISNAKNVCDREGEKDDIGGQNAQGPTSWPSFSSGQLQGMAVALALVQCPLGTSGPTGLSHLCLAHRAVEICSSSFCGLASRRCASTTVLSSAPHPSPETWWAENTSPLPSPVKRVVQQTSHASLPTTAQSYTSRLSQPAGLLSWG